MMWKKFLLLCTCFIPFVKAWTQSAVDVLPGNAYMHYINYSNADLDSIGRWNFFNLNRYTSFYSSRALNAFSIEGQLTYQLAPWIGLSGGGGFYNQGFVPALGLSLSFQNQRGNFFAQLYPTAAYAEKQFVPSILGFVGFNPKWNDRWGWSHQLLFSIDPSEVSQLYRLGWSYRDKIQFGLGIDATSSLLELRTLWNAGPFVRICF